jgi:Fe-S cluster assembly ATP-binding protein
MALDQAALEVLSLSARADGATVLSDVDLTIRQQQTHLLFGPNGSGKSSLLKTIMGLSPYRVASGQILVFGERVDDLPVDRRANLGIGLAFQGPPGIDGVSVAALATALGAKQALAEAVAALDLVGFESRGVNIGFSGGEVKRWEVAKLLLQRPRLFLVDEPDSGVDLEHIAAVADGITRLREQRRDPAWAGLIVSHTGSILDHMDADVGHLMVDGQIVHTGAPREILAHIQQHGYVVPGAVGAGVAT